MENKDRKIYREAYDPEYWTERALSLAEGIDPDECAAWANHPCTRVLLYSLQGDVAGIIQGWLNGGYADGESIDATAQMQAKARGMGQACDDVIETIGIIGKGQFGNND